MAEKSLDQALKELGEDTAPTKKSSKKSEDTPVKSLLNKAKDILGTGAVRKQVEIIQERERKTQAIGDEDRLKGATPRGSRTKFE